MPRVYARKFDWDEARARYAAGDSITDIARDLGVTWTAVQRVVVPGKALRMAAYRRAWSAQGRCDDCGGPMSKTSRGIGRRRCRPCATKLRATSVRDNELRCVTCRQWLPDERFPNSASEPIRRGRSTQCRSCQTIAKRDYRRRNREKVRAYDRAYKAKRRAKAA